jgi:hypothetical protein
LVGDLVASLEIQHRVVEILEDRAVAALEIFLDCFPEAVPLAP